MVKKSCWIFFWKQSVLKEKARNNYRNLSEGEKEKKKEYRRNRCRNMKESKKKKKKANSKKMRK